jgi:hypothetical protein
MTAIERKENTEKLLEALGIRLRDQLPPMEEESVVVLKTPQEIAERTLILTYLTCAASQSALRQEIITFLKQEGLWEKTSETEKQLFHKAQLTDVEETMIAWRGESIWLLLWIMNKVDMLDLPTDEVDPHEIFARLPEFMTSTSDFVSAATIRPVSEILDQSDLIFRLNWAIKEADQYDSNETAFNPGVAYERHFAISWAMSISNQWDDAEDS